MKRTTTLLSLFLVVSNFIGAQDSKITVLNANVVSKLDLNGKWSGTRKQYSADKKSFIETFQYEFELKQTGNLVTGTSTIISSNGDYADMKLEGIIIGNKLHFREYEVQSAIRPDGKVWCFKSGELNLSSDGENLQLVGSTPSYMEVYNYPCTGGMTELTKADNSANQSVVSNTSAEAPEVNRLNQVKINAYPDPFIDNANISYNLNSDSKIRVEVYDISGQLISSLFEGSQNAGNYTLNFNAKNFNSMSGIYVVKFTVNDQVYSRQMVQMR